MLRKLFSKLIGGKKKAKSAAPKKTAPKKKTAVKKKTGSPKKPAKKAAKPAAKKTSKKTAPAKKPAAPPPGPEIGEVVAFFRIPVVAVIKITSGKLTVGDTIQIEGHTTRLKQAVNSMQINHRPIQQASKGQEIGIKIASRARRGDRVYLLGA